MPIRNVDKRLCLCQHVREKYTKIAATLTRSNDTDDANHLTFMVGFYCHWMKITIIIWYFARIMITVTGSSKYRVVLYLLRLNDEVIVFVFEWVYDFGQLPVQPSQPPHWEQQNFLTFHRKETLIWVAAETRELAVGPQSIFLKTEARKGGRAACSAARASQFSQLSAICSHNAGARSRSKPAAAASEASDPCQMTWLFQNYLLIKTNFQHFYFWFINTKSLEIRCVNQRQASKSL